MIKRIGTIKLDIDRLVLVAERENIKIFRSIKYHYLTLRNGKYTLLVGNELKKYSLLYDFKIEMMEKSHNIVHANLTDHQLSKLKGLEKRYKINTSQAIKKLIETI